MILASAQTKPIRGNINANIEDHIRLVNIASREGANLILFPEMSLTGYERENASMFQFENNDSRLDPLKEIAELKEIIIIAGAPIRINEHLYIGSFVISPDRSIEIYTKHFLHPGEEISFKHSFEYDPLIEIENEKISLAICADIDHIEHPRMAAERGTTIYLPGIFFSPNGIPEAYSVLSSYAKEFSMCILMSNFGGPSWGQESGGKSAFWDNRGKLLCGLGSGESGLLLVESRNEGWNCLILEVYS